mmetsp:Transcript_38811/g.91273  ORF Transcript_38811/g.91273 Transcript_38811/m.91273 type:complete len:273 (+) Transcript_38811:92-910(+)
MAKKAAKAASGGGGVIPTGKKKRNPYNEHVQRYRQEKYYDRKKALNRFKRYCKFEEKQKEFAAAQDGALEENDRHGASALMKQVLKEGASAVEEDYEQRLNLSFGGAALNNPLKAVPSAKKRSKKKKAAASEEGVSEPKSQKASTVDEQRRIDDKNSSASAPQARQGKKATVPVATPPVTKTGKNGTTDKKAKSLQGSRYAKALAEYEEKQRARQAELDQRQQEIRSRNQQRREGAKQRALKGQLLSRRTQRGQPRMESLLEAVTRKLQLPV